MEFRGADWHLLAPPCHFGAAEVRLTSNGLAEGVAFLGSRADPAARATAQAVAAGPGSGF